MTTECEVMIRFELGPSSRIYTGLPCTLKPHTTPEHQVSGALDDGTVFTLTWIAPIPSTTPTES